MNRTSTLLAALVLALAGAPLASSAPTATATLVVDLSPLGGQGTATRCDVTLPVGANGVDVLNAAVAQGCIDAWTAVSYGPGQSFVDCLDAAGPAPSLCTVCPPPYLACGYWAMTFDGAYASESVEGFVVGEDLVLAFEYSVFPLELVPGP